MERYRPLTSLFEGRREQKGDTNGTKIVRLIDEMHVRLFGADDQLPVEGSLLNPREDAVREGTRRR